MSNNSHNYNFTFSSFCELPPILVRQEEKREKREVGKEINFSIAPTVLFY